ncbi:MAG: nucleotidyltransferase domain-containing protein [bacterium]
MKADHELIDEIIRRILEVAHPERIILFGSAASNEMTPDSDIDLLILERDPDGKRERRSSIRRALQGMGYPFDIILMTPERFEESKNIVGGMAYPAHKYGKVIYEAA